MTHPDETLNYYADAYAAQRLRAHGLGLETYLAATPEQRAGYDALALEPEPLLPAQGEVMDRP